MKTRTFPVLLASSLIAAGLTLSACQKKPQHEDLQLGQSAIHKASAVGQVLADSAITTRIETQLATDESLSGSPVHVTTKHGVATLSGTVSSESARTRAAEIATNTEGVKGVINNLKVAPTN
ncbi:MAG: BON domain-containing protein [Gammaproteobacteria bacterium]